MRCSTNASRALAALADEPGEHTGHVMVLTVTGEHFRVHTNQVTFTDLGVIIDDAPEGKPVTFIPTANVALIEDAPAEPAPQNGPDGQHEQAAGHPPAIGP